MKKILTYGTFDLIHAGHINLLRRAKDLGDYLVVGISTDEFNKVKNKQAYHTFDNRKMILESIRFVDKVIPEYSWDQKIDDVKRYHIDIFVMGDDWKGQFDFLQEYCEVVYFPRTEGISTSEIKRNMNNNQ
ncbi:glycerol-3-phosphate cytidylyltransferase [Oceanobacillus profundus]|uniref:Glycerol-3-phosphate cytidylyltransferase n=1 Tax=Oceanobacillus profundus TaxID=372463 RepID=A0A417YP95_9BACI|nr:glycerol-3-phosphate cytidylyltransferase [Oceanobacillus profundus]MCM3400355.1 glycerol-3-phosphate cytidylyltransferase [Oceanobacillus profundus]MDO6451262.1 glycerol-3-phosphate cytidylyltransferase [Oceanobacillus profundus]PAE30398.1 glycerol-3-phosphate cytidylyltransferase [Paenibacillus sp. 7884-2]RHW35517.1 glycerol-3-phosphate cytidylyltransferase [Oceanobacillus profundus]